MTGSKMMQKPTAGTTAKPWKQKRKEDDKLKQHLIYILYDILRLNNQDIESYK